MKKRESSKASTRKGGNRSGSAGTKKSSAKRATTSGANSRSKSFVPATAPPKRASRTAAAGGNRETPASPGRPAKSGAKTLSSKTSASNNKKPSAKTRSAPPKALATSQDPVQFPEERPKKIKTPLTAKQLREFKELLLRKRAQLAGDVRRLTSEALHRNDNGSNDRSSMPIHMADLGSDNWEQDFTLGLIANEEALVRDIDDALERIEDRTYGICLGMHTPISLARLQAKPWAKYCIEYARLREEGRAP